jgi:hypothetical protein
MTCTMFIACCSLLLYVLSTRIMLSTSKQALADAG